MGRYIEWDDVIDRYPEIETLGGSDEVSSTYIAYAEAMTDGLLSNYFTPPFSNNNMTVKDLTIDCVFWRAGKFKLENATRVQSAYFESVDMLNKGQMKMVTASGEVLSSFNASPGVYSSTQSYHTAFGIDDPVNWAVDSDYLDATQDARD